MSFTKNYKRLFCLAWCSLACWLANAQNCPPNIDFERGTFDGWTCYTGTVAAVGTENIISLSPSYGPVFDRHTMLSANPGDGLDPYGNFPVNCPNGSGHSIKLGNNVGGGLAEGISYQFTIPSNQNTYNLIYHYAVVFQDPNHQQNEQPRMEIIITNVTDNTIISCSSFTFFPYGSLLPGFQLSSVEESGTPIWYKDWSAVSINLDNMAGKTIQLFFKTADCTFRRHFGYAYIDINSECSGEFVGANYCKDDTAVNVVAPYGYQNYTWYNKTFTQVLGHDQVLTLKPPPPPGTDIAVEVVPYDGYGCLDTLFAKMTDTLTVRADAGPDGLSCNSSTLLIGSNARLGLVYHWEPPDGLSNPDISNPRAGPAVTTQYILSVNSSGGGCRTEDTVLITASFVDTNLLLIGKDVYCLGSGDSALLKVVPTQGMQWYRNNIPINGETGAQFLVDRTGDYYALLSNKDGCVFPSRTQHVFIDKPRPPVNLGIQYALINVPITVHARQFGEKAVWSPPLFLDNINTYNPSFRGDEDQKYTIAITTNTGCLTVDTLLVKTISNVQIYVPNAFTPNKDGLNDYLYPVLMGISDLHYFRVFNRWGQVIFDSKTERPGWDGTVNGVPQGSGVVVWMLEGLGIDGTIYRKKGTAVIVR